jgi:hypothetical protein
MTMSMILLNKVGSFSTTSAKILSKLSNYFGLGNTIQQRKMHELGISSLKFAF